MASNPALRRSCRIQREHDAIEAGSKSSAQPAKKTRLSGLVQTCQYNTLDKHSSQIRLFELLPGEKDDPLRGRLRVVDLNTDPKYDAVSYVWGDPQPRFPLEIDNDGLHELIIPENLHKALIGLRLKRSSRTLWVDAICINQKDVQERNHQVRIMEEIYKKACLVRVWLDVDVNPRSQAFRMASRLKGPDTSWLFPNSKKRQPDYTVALIDYDPEFWEPLYDVFESPYWERVWTQQEYLLAKNLLFHVPRGTFTPEPLVRFDKALSKSSIEYNMHDGPLLPLGYERRVSTIGISSSLYDSFEAMHSRGSESFMLIHLFLMTRNLKAADLRDHVYALTGIAIDCDQGDIEPNYNTAPFLVYQQVVQHHVLKQQSVDFLCYTSYSNDHSFPSWMPSFTKVSDIGNAFKTKNAADLPPPMTSHSTAFHDSVLVLRGIKCDSIASTGMSDLSDQPILQWSKLVQDMLGFSRWTEQEPILKLLNAWESDEVYPYVFNRPKRTPVELGKSLSSLLAFVIKNCPKATVRDLARYGRPEDAEFSDDLFQLTRLLNITMDNGTFTKTDKNRLGLCFPNCNLPECQVRPGDEVWIIFGCGLPLVLRPQQQREYPQHASKVYSVIGYSVFPGLIAEECKGLLPDGSVGETYKGLPPEDITLV